MAKTQSEAEKQTAVMDEGRGHHIGDFLPPEELNKFMNKYKVYTIHTLNVVKNIEHRKRWRSHRNVLIKPALHEFRV